MKANWILFLCYILLPWSDVYGQNVGFFREYWATFDRNVSNSGSRWKNFYLAGRDARQSLWDAANRLHDLKKYY